MINPENPDGSDVAWICDGCGAMLNVQAGFNEDCGEWICTECGYTNTIDASKIYVSETEYQASLKDPYKGLSDEAVLALSKYVDEAVVDGHPDIRLIRDRETGEIRVKKLLSTYDIRIYNFLKDHPVAHMPRILGFYEGDNCLIVIEEYISGRTVDDLMNDGRMTDDLSLSIIKQVCVILYELHNLPKPIIHRDIKPSNIIVSPDSEAYLVDVNVAKLYDPTQTDDTKHLGTENYAAPEQAGYGLHASSTKSDVYGLGVLLNVMLTGKFPKEKVPEGALGDIIKRCISLNAEDRYTVKELMTALNEAG